ncbi:hypothetical protein JOC77_000709 [Peribacillus deserti]|uniref:Uncharacterized protein n=1 Tax=Peribacillus deserti TaxID=673318 RepID=A0ABS2QEP5_9BACI|nr:DUF6155 family protein [Peribacillus deserti]MBM7691304.1 hypothetical protein [Peribacillus deserti]
MTLLKLNELKKELKALDHKELIQLITEIYKVNKDVQHFLSNKFLGEEAINDLYKKTKKKVKDEFFPERGFGKLRLGEAKNAISNFKKLSSDELKTLDLMILYVELGTEFTNAYGDINMKFYDSMVSMFDKVVIECHKNEKVLNSFKSRLYTIVQESEGIGWGYHEVLCDIYYSLDLEEDE